MGSLGMFVYEMLTGLPPWYTKDRKELFRRIQRAQLTFPDHVSRKARLLITGFLTRDPSKRLGTTGAGGFQKLKKQPFFSNIDWHLLRLRKLRPPFAPRPRQSSSVDTANFATEFTRLPVYSNAGHPGSHTSNGSSATDSPTFKGFSYEGSPSRLNLAAASEQ